MISMFLNLLPLLWCSSKIKRVVICKSIPVEIARNFIDQPLNKVRLSRFSPKTAPIGVVNAKITSMVYFFIDLTFTNINDYTNAVKDVKLCSELFKEFGLYKSEKL